MLSLVSTWNSGINDQVLQKNEYKENRILVVDDEPDVTELLKYKLLQEDCRCRC